MKTTLKKILLVAACAGLLALPSMVSAQCAAGPCLASATVSASNDLLALFGAPDQESWQVENVSVMTQQRVVGPVARWQTMDGEFTVEHLAGVSPEGDLLVFFWSPPAGWHVVNVSAISGQRVVGPVVNWQTPDGPFIVEHLAGVSADGDLVIFFWSPRADWQAVNVSALTGQHVANVSAAITAPVSGPAKPGQLVLGPLTNWQTQKDQFTVEHLAGLSPEGDLLVFFWSPQADWQAVNVSTITGQRVAGPVTSWQLQDGQLTVENLAGVSSNGDLLVFWASQPQDWRAVNVSRITGKQVMGPVTSWVKGKLDHLAAVGLNEKGIYVFWNLGFGRQQPNPSWGYCDISLTGCTKLLSDVK